MPSPATNGPSASSANAAACASRKLPSPSTRQRAELGSRVTGRAHRGPLPTWDASGVRTLAQASTELPRACAWHHRGVATPRQRALTALAAGMLVVTVSACGASGHKTFHQQVLAYLGPQTVNATHPCGYLDAGKGWRVHTSPGVGCGP